MSKLNQSGRFARLVATALLCVAGPALADVSVTTSGNVATALVQLPSAASPQYTASITITFDSVVNLTPGALNLTASIVDPATINLGLGVSIDPNFPVLISVEPPVALYRNSFESGEVGDGNLDFLNTYEMEVHTVNLACSSTVSQYRLYKAPHGSTVFADVTSNLFAGSVRARGRGGAFSQFLVVKDTQLLLTAALGKITGLTARLLISGITGPLLTSLTTLLGTVLADVVSLNLGGAISALGQFITEVTNNAGSAIANEWTAGGALTNDAGDLLSLAQSLLFTLNQLNGVATCAPAP